VTEKALIAYVTPTLHSEPEKNVAVYF